MKNCAVWWHFYFAFFISSDYIRSVKDAFVCKPWLALAVVSGLFHISWVLTLAVCQVCSLHTQFIFIRLSKF